MTFGTIKSLIEKNLLESYKNEMEFKKTLREFIHVKKLMEQRRR